MPPDAGQGKRIDIYDLLKSIQVEKGTTIVAITHDLNLAAQYCDETLLLSSLDGPSTPEPHFRIGKTSEILTPEAVERVFEIRVFSGMVGHERFLIPLGARAKDADRPGPPA